jgi:hypothetical protein
VVVSAGELKTSQTGKSSKRKRIGFSNGPD